MQRSLLLAGAAALAIGAMGADRASAAIMLAELGSSTALGNLDAGSLADSVATSATIKKFDILYTNALGDTSGGYDISGEWTFDFQVSDVLEVGGGEGISFSFSAAVTGSSSPGASVYYRVGSYQVDAELSDGDRIATVTFTTRAVGGAPDDDAADVALTGTETSPFVVADPGLGNFAGVGGFDSLNVYDAINNNLATSVGYDLQTDVPLPASALLLFGGLAGLAGLRRRG
jgi:hypothetical protein